MDDLEKQRKNASEELVRALHKCAVLTDTFEIFNQFVSGFSFAVFGMAKMNVKAEEIIEALRDMDMATMPMSSVDS